MIKVKMNGDEVQFSDREQFAEAVLDEVGSGSKVIIEQTEED